MPEPFLEPLSERLKDMHEIERQLIIATTTTDPPFRFAYSPLDRDMRRFEATRMVEPRLTHAWHEATWRCCMRPGALVIDVGGNFGWYTLFSAALGCSVLVVEPVKEYRAVIAAGLNNNPGFAQRVRVDDRVVHDRSGLNLTLRVPVPVPGSRYKRLLGMAGLVDGEFGVVKGVVDNYIHLPVRSIRLDELLHLVARPMNPLTAAARSQQPRSDGAVGRAPLSEGDGGERGGDGGPPVCMLKADVEGYEPLVFRSAGRLLRSGRVHAVQFEMTRPARGARGKQARAQRDAGIAMLRGLARRGLDDEPHTRTHTHTHTHTRERRAQIPVHLRHSRRRGVLYSAPLNSRHCARAP